MDNIETVNPHSAKAIAESSIEHTHSAKIHAEAAMECARTAKSNSDTSIADAQTARGNAEASTVDAQTTKTNADNAITSAHAAKASAEAATHDAQIAKANAEASGVSAQNSKTNADAIVINIQTTKNNEETSTADAKTTKANLNATIKNAEIAEKNASTSSTNAQLAKTHLEAIIGDAAITKKSAEASTNDAKDIETILDKVLANASTAQNSSNSVEANAKNAEKEFIKAKESRIKAEREAELAAQAHNMSTTVGLAGAFNEKAKAATQRLYYWSIALMVSLVLIAVIGHSRIDKVLELIQQAIGKSELTATIGIEIIFLLSNIAAPAWFAWLATKLISKYFHLSEDYSYKAAISQAYLGFKEQASGLDPIFQERLLAAAITQLDANPLRSFEQSEHPGSPIQDLLQQPFMQSALQELSFKNSVTNWLRKTFKTNFYLSKSHLTKTSQLQVVTSPVVPETSPSSHPV
ncbi:MAG: hypothetical protein ABI296_00830 [Gammaproteobacteria bacterium]